ncbi:MAG: glutamate--tRNA ligase [Bdellovibrionales bacterium]
MSVVTRFPPSPTGFMHIGNARTALFNWLYAKHTGGKFVVRIEDTDRKRHSEEAVQAIIDGLKWLGLEHDDEITSQFANQQRHRDIAEELLSKGLAYKCYCSPEELQDMRDKARKEGKQASYDRRWRDSDKTPPNGIDPVIRVKAPLDGETTIQDKVQGTVTIQNENLDDFIILRSDGTPTYMLSVVVDDHDMGITHIMRGDDHLNNTFRQKVIFDAMDWDVPEFAHLPLIHGPDGAKFSKRHGAQSVEEYKDMGYLPEAMCNYLLRLGWGRGDEEIIPSQKAIEWFDFDGIGKAAAKFDFAKLESLNAHYIAHTNNEELMHLSLPFYVSRHGIEPNQEAQSKIISHMDELKLRAKTLLQLSDESVFYAKSCPFDFDEKASNLLNAEANEILQALHNTLEISDWTEEAIQGVCKDVAENLRNGKLGKVAMPLRAALTGTTISPSIFKAAEILGRDETRTRIQSAMNFIQNKA